MPTLAIEIVILAHSAGLFMHEAIESACIQTTLQCECMIVDDGLTDKTPSGLAAYRDVPIRWIWRTISGSVQLVREGSH